MVMVQVHVDDDVYQVLQRIAAQHGVRGVPDLLEAAGRHVARTQGGYTRRRVRYLTPDIELPAVDDVAPRPVPTGGPRIDRISADARAKQATVVRLYRDDLESMRDIAAMVGLGVGTVRSLLIDAKVTIRPKGHVHGKVRRAG